jgi:hypothetical protein
VTAQELTRAELECRACHAVADLTKTDPITGREVNLTIDLDAYAQSDHANVRCYDCHERGYETLPHTGPRQYPRFLCVDCHRDNDKLAPLRFERRRDELLGSVHGKQAEHRFDCHDCHNPHEFRLVRARGSALDRIRAGNQICLDCHGPQSKRNVSFRDLPNVLDKHERLPHKRNHFRKVKCVSCHTPADSATRHDVRGKDEIAFECTQCHSPDSAVLQATYARPQDAGGPALDAAQADGLRENAYVVGSSRSRLLDWISIAGFVLAALLVAAHAIARMLHSRKP